MYPIISRYIWLHNIPFNPNHRIISHYFGNITINMSFPSYPKYALFHTPIKPFNLPWQLQVPRSSRVRRWVRVRSQIRHRAEEWAEQHWKAGTRGSWKSHYQRKLGSNLLSYGQTRITRVHISDNYLLTSSTTHSTTIQYNRLHYIILKDNTLQRNTPQYNSLHLTTIHYTTTVSTPHVFLIWQICCESSGIRLLDSCPLGFS